jgi:hypothetical protein
LDRIHAPVAIGFGPVDAGMRGVVFERVAGALGHGGAVAEQPQRCGLGRAGAQAPAHAACFAAASEAHFARSFKRAFGETPHRYLTRRRIERAQELLRGTGRPRTDVALDVGFDTPSSFSRVFRQITGEPPSAYAKRWRAAGAPPVPACFALMYTRPLGLSSSGQADRPEPG